MQTQAFNFSGLYKSNLQFEYGRRLTLSRLDLLLSYATCNYFLNAGHFYNTICYNNN